MDVLDLSRWQFGITTVYHLLFVPLTIGLSVIVAGLQTAWFRTKNPAYLGLTKFWGKLFLINFAMGVVTGIVQEFQFGMNWSDYSRFVGDVFGAPLAMEGLMAFFLESTFLGLWIFGWDRLSPRLHLATIWIFGVLAGLLALAGLWLTRRGRLPENPWFHRIAIWGIGLPFLANSLGWIFIEMGRQPWTVFGIMRTAAAVSPGVDVTEAARRAPGDLQRRLGTATAGAAGRLPEAGDEAALPGGLHGA